MMKLIRPTHMDIYSTLVLSLTLGLLAVLFINQQHSTTVQLKVMTTNAKVRTQQIHDLQKHLDCVVALASQPNHQTLYIKDIQSCQITNGQVTTTSAPAKPSSLSVAVPQPSSPMFVSSSSPQSAPNSSNKQAETPTPKPSLIQQLLNKL